MCFSDAVTSLAKNNQNIFLVSEEQLWKSEIGEPLHFSVVPLQQNKVVQVACGEAHVLVLTDKGYVFSHGMSPACGLGLDDEQEEKEFIRIQCLSDVFFIAAGTKHSAALRYTNSRWLKNMNLKAMLFFEIFISKMFSTSLQWIFQEEHWHYELSLFM